MAQENHRPESDEHSYKDPQQNQILQCTRIRQQDKYDLLKVRKTGLTLEKSIDESITTTI